MRHTCILSFMRLFLLLGLSSCWNENVKDCWMGDVTIHVMAERFQELPGGKTEDVLSARIRSVHYYLYQEGVLYKQGSIEEKAALSGQNVPISFSRLPFGNYTLSVMGNVSTGETVTYPGPTKTQDYFVSSYAFTVDCDCLAEDFVTLYRSQGVTQFQLENLPDNITEIEVSMNKLGQTCQADTTYQGETNLSYRVKVAEVTSGTVASVVIGSFPTVGAGESEFIVRLYAENDPTFVAFEKKVKATIVRNKLLLMKRDFNHSISGNVPFDIIVNPKWDGVHGGDLPIE